MIGAILKFVGGFYLFCLGLTLSIKLYDKLKNKKTKLQKELEECQLTMENYKLKSKEFEDKYNNLIKTLAEYGLELYSDSQGKLKLNINVKGGEYEHKR